MNYNHNLVQNAESTVRRSADAGSHTLYLTYNPGPTARNVAGYTETFVLPIRLPKSATDVVLNGPGNYNKRGTGTIYGVKIVFKVAVDDKKMERSRTIALPHPVVDVQLLDRKPDAAYRFVS